MSIVTGILNIAEDQARAAGAKVINSIEVEIGDLAGVEIESLLFCFDAARQSSLARNAELIVQRIPGLGFCLECDRDVPLSYPVAVCETCGQAILDVKQGREMRVKSINVD